LAQARQEKIILGAALALVCALAWAYTLWHPHAMGFGALFLMWLAMMGAMMLPATAPMLDAFATINRRRREREAPYVATAFFVAGYLIVWAGFSVAAVIVQWTLERAALLDEMLSSTSPVLSGVLFLAAGLYQWTPLKELCLTRCRSPAGFVLSEWRDGRLGATVMGLRHGAFCVGCCAALMALLFAVSVMNVLWLAALTVLVMAEKLLPGGKWLRHTIGAGLTVFGITFLARAFLF
jgi:predicted metal-binding membrane protein